MFRLATTTTLIVACLCVSVAPGCVINIKTPSVPSFERLQSAEPEVMSRTDFEILMGTPQSVGIHWLDGTKYALTYYYGIMGQMTVFPGQSAQLDSGMVFAAFDGEDNLSELVYVTSDFDGPKLNLGGGSLSVVDVAEGIEAGVSTIDELESILGEPSYRGRRFSSGHGVHHDLAFFDTSEVGRSGVVKERWLLAGFDEGRIVQDLLWASSFEEELESIGKVELPKLRRMTRMDYGYRYWVTTTESVSSSNRIDPVQVEALLRTQPATIDEYVEVLGTPTARGFKTFEEHEPWAIAHWSHMSTDFIGNERNPAMDNSVNEDGTPRERTYMVMDVQTTRLMVAHTPEGEVKEVIWLRPTSSAATSAARSSGNSVASSPGSTRP